MTQCTLYACGGGGGSQQREVADGTDVVFRDTGSIKPSDYKHRIIVLAGERRHNAHLTAKITLFVRFDLFIMTFTN